MIPCFTGALLGWVQRVPVDLKFMGLGTHGFSDDPFNNNDMEPMNF